MPNYRRAKEGNTYFFTVVTYNRQPILCWDTCRNVLREVIQETREAHPFKTEAWVLLPDHIHCIWQLPEGDKDYSMRWGLIKKGFTQRTKGLVGTAHPTIRRK
jgi:putative transposase